ncbi:hypothetical protein BKA69DRAFT_1072875 [Paraphysoderma sedebokerense]|nr:hypothetical protein BKA69DRAFT_1072875 [Paraphysoderma sedebokerense]
MSSTSFRAPSSCMSDLETLAFRGPVTALAFLSNNILISGAGPFLKFIDVTNGRIMGTEDVFSGSRIHEIVVGMC